MVSWSLSTRFVVQIEAFTVTKEYGWVLSRGAFICGTSNLQVCARRCCGTAHPWHLRVSQVSAKMSLCGSAAGEGLFLTKVILFGATAYAARLTRRDR